MDIEGKTALVTGGASGIGLACVRELVRHGAQVSICDCDVPKGEQALKELQDEFGPGKVIFIKTDVTIASEFEGAFKTTILTFKALDIVLNNAGFCDILDWERTIAVNFNAVVRGIQLSLRYMGKDNGGRGGILVNTASVLGLSAIGSQSVYVATKHAVIGLTRSYGMPHHLDKTGVKVVAICPGLTDTSLAARAMSANMDEGLIDQIKKDVAHMTIQKPEYVAAGMMVLLKVAESGSVWVSEDMKPVYEVKQLDYQTLRK